MTAPSRQAPVRLPAELWQALAAIAKAEGVSVDTLIQRAVASSLRGSKTRDRRLHRP